MALSINQNITALNAYRNLSNTQNKLSTSLERLSSGLRINRAADDAAGLAISEGLRSQVGGLKVAARNAQDGISVVQTAEGALTEVHSILQRLRDLAVQGGNDSNSTAARDNITTEANSLISELNRIADSTNFNGTKLLDATAGSGADGKLTFQVGADGDKASTIQVDLSTANVQTVATTLGFDTATGAVKTGASTVTPAGGTTKSSIDKFDVSDNEHAQATINTIDAQIGYISTARANLGAYQNRLDHTINSVNVTMENLSASESRIRDTDMASEMVSFTNAQILSQAGTAMLAQANSMPQTVLQLLK